MKFYLWVLLTLACLFGIAHTLSLPFSWWSIPVELSYFCIAIHALYRATPYIFK